MSFDTSKSRSLTHSVPFPRGGILGETESEILYVADSFIDK